MFMRWLKDCVSVITEKGEKTDDSKRNENLVMFMNQTKCEDKKNHYKKRRRRIRK